MLFIFIFWWVKKYVYTQKERCKLEYMGCIQKAQSGKSTKKPDSLSQQDPNQSTKSIKGIELSFINISTQANRLLRNSHFNLFSDCCSFLNTLWFLSYHKVQKNIVELLTKPSSIFSLQKNVILKEFLPLRKKAPKLHQIGRTKIVIEPLTWWNEEECFRPIPLLFNIDSIYSPTTMLAFEADPMPIFFPNWLP